MKKQKKSFLKVLVTLALAAVLCIGLSVPAFAALDANGAVVGGTPAAPAEAEITKKLTMADGVATPAATFTFEIDAISKDGSTAAAATMPAIANKTVTYTAGEAATATTGGVKDVVKGTSNILAGITWPAAGVYQYEIHETTGTWATANETMAYSGGVYTMRVYVDNDASGPYVQAVGIEVKTVDNSTQTPGDKVDPTPGTGGGGLLFTNTFTKKGGGGNPATADLASISKAVAGMGADQTKYFPFEVTVTQPTVGVPAAPAATYKAFVVDSTGAVVTSASHYAGTLQADPTYGNYIEMTSGTQETINLKHGEKLAFNDIHVGATYAANELAAVDYTASVTVVANGGTPVTTNAAAANTAHATGTQTIGDTGANTAAFTNTYKTITPTGVIINNLPFIMILVLAAGAFVAFVVVKSRKRAASH